MVPVVTVLEVRVFAIGIATMRPPWMNQRHNCSLSRIAA